MENINRFKRGVKALTGPAKNPQNAAELQMQQWVKQIEKINTQHTAERAQKDLYQVVNSIVENADLVEDLLYNNSYKDQISFILNFDFAQDDGSALVLEYAREYKFKGLQFTYVINVDDKVMRSVGFCKIMAGNSSWLQEALEACGFSQDEPIARSFQERNASSLAEVLKFIAGVEVLMQNKQSSVCAAIVKHKQKLIERIKAAGFTDSQVQFVQSFW